MQLYDVDRGVFRDGGHGGGIFDGTISGLGQIFSMPEETQAKLKSCSDQCESQYGVASGAPDVAALIGCFAQCNAQYPPTIAAAAQAEPLLTLPTPAALEPAPATKPIAPTAPTAQPSAGMSAGAKAAIALAGLAVLGGAGYFIYRALQKKQSAPRMTSNRAKRPRTTVPRYRALKRNVVKPGWRIKK